MALPPERTGREAPPDLAARRAGIAGAVASGLWTVDPPPRELMLGGVRALCFDPPGTARATVLHLHGGAFRLGCPEQIAPFAAALAKRCGVAVVCPAYRLAPEYPFPAALNDARAVLLALQQADAGPVVLAGDSAGGGLAASLASLARHDTLAPIGLILLSAWLDLTVSAASYGANAASDPLFSRESAAEAADLYLQGIADNDPLASPLLADPAGFPPAFISVGAGEVLVDDARTLAARLDAAGVAARLDIVPGMDHVAVTRSMDLPGAAQTFDAVATFIATLAG